MNSFPRASRWFTRALHIAYMPRCCIGVCGFGDDAMESIRDNGFQSSSSEQIFALISVQSTSPSTPCHASIGEDDVLRNVGAGSWE